MKNNDPSPRIQKQVVAVVGPTASGKTSLALILAKKICGEIISADSRQLFRFMHIGTAKPTEGELEQVPHHFVNLLNPDQEFNASDFGDAARQKIEELHTRDVFPIIVGGSGLYVRAIIDGFFSGPGKNNEIRDQLEQMAKEQGSSALFEKLKSVDPISAEKMDPTKIRRIIRALEVYSMTGKPISDLHSMQERKTSFHVLQYALEWDRKVLYERINHRVDQMIEKGLLDEVRRLKELGYSSNLNSLNTVGYKEANDHLAGKITREEMVRLIKQNTRRYAKRQLTWFRADKRIQWIRVNEETEWDIIAEKIYLDLKAAASKSRPEN